jgi:predicted PurR-regulated permease PerM
VRSVRLAEQPLVLAVAAGFAFWIGARVLERALWVVVLVLVSAILAAALAPLVDVLRRPAFPPNSWRLPKAVAVMLIYLAIVVAFGLMSYFLGGIFVSELQRFIQMLPLLVDQFAERYTTLEQVPGIEPEFLPTSEDLAAQAQALATGLLGLLRGLVAGVIDGIFRLFIVLILTLFLIVESDRIFRFWLGLFPQRHRDRVRDVTAQIGYKVGWWLLGQVAVASIAGTLAGLAAWLLGLPYPLLIGVTTAILDLAPVLGTALMTIPAFLLGLLQSPLMGLAAGLVFYGLSQLDGNVLSPLITGRAVKLSPTLVIIATPFGLALYGPLGALIAIPVTAALQVIATELLLPWLRAQQGRESAAGTEDEKRAGGDVDGPSNSSEGRRLGAAAAGPDAAGMAEVIEDGGAESAIRQVR